MKALDARGARATSLRLTRPECTEHARLHSDAILVIAQSISSFADVSESAAAALAPDAEYRIREIVQDGLKFMKHSKRSRLSTNDINAALRLRNVAPVYGFRAPGVRKNATSQYRRSSGSTGTRTPVTVGILDELHYSRVDGAPKLFFVQDREVGVRDLLASEPPTRPLQSTVSAHWLAVDANQPATLDNPVLFLSAKSSRVGPVKGLPETDAREVKAMLRHDLSRELQLYYEQVAGGVFGLDAAHLDACLHSVAQQPGLGQLLPYFTQFVYRTVTQSTRDLSVLFSCMRLTSAILKNSAFHLEPYLQQLLPAVVTCIVGKRLCSDPRENHWALRDFATETVSAIFRKYGKKYSSIQPRFTATVARALTDTRRPLTTHYGAIVGLGALGPYAANQLLVPRIASYVKKIEVLLSDAKTVATRRIEASKVFGALVWAMARMESSAGFTNLSQDNTPNLSRARKELARLEEFQSSVKGELGARFHPYGEGLSESDMSKAIHAYK